MPSRIRLGVAVLTAVAFALVVTGAGSAQIEGSSRYGGTLVVGLRAEPSALDPTVSGAFVNVVVYGTICERLYDLDSKAQVAPQLAAALPVVSKDRLTYTIPLRHGVKFNDNTPFDATAVMTTLQRNMTLNRSTRKSDLESVDSVSAPGPYTVVIHLKSRFTPLLDKLSTSASAIMSPTQLSKLGDDFGSSPVCVGPFMFDNRVPGDSITVIKSPYYCDRNDVHLDKIVFKPMPDAAAAAAALEAGDLQVLDDVSTAELDGLASSSNLRIVKRNMFGYQAIGFNIGNISGTGMPYSNLGTPFASSATLRKAFEEAIDRTALARVVFGGNVQTGCTPISPASSWFDATVKCTPYDPADARKLVTASGFRNLTLHLVTESQTDQLRLAQFIQAEEKAVGIYVVIDQPSDSSDAVRKGHYEAVLSGWNGRNEPDHNMFVFLATSGSRNNRGYSNPRLDLILANAREATATQARKALYHAAQEIILNDRSIIYLDHPIKFVGVSTKVTGVQISSDLTLRVAFAQFK